MKTFVIDTKKVKNKTMSSIREETVLQIQYASGEKNLLIAWFY